MKTVTMYTDDVICFANPQNAPIRSCLRRNRSGMAVGAAGGKLR